VANLIEQWYFLIMKKFFLGDAGAGRVNHIFEGSVNVMVKYYLIQ
jgi:hypothetical protein